MQFTPLDKSSREIYKLFHWGVHLCSSVPIKIGKMKIDIYKLGEYKIIESDTGELRWEAHSGFATIQEGRCFRKGPILFIGPAENDRVGFLKGDFLDHIKSFPKWSKTKYCCRSLEIYHCRTYRKVTKQEMLLWILDRGIDEGDSLYSEESDQRSDYISVRGAAGDVPFRLQRYEITKKSAGQILWKTPAGPNTVRGGTCTVLEDILFIGPRQDTQSDLIRRQFVANLQQLPKWDQTKYYSAKSSLHDCRSWNSVQEKRKRWPRSRRAAEKHDARKGRKKSSKFKLERSDLWENRAMLFFRRAGKCVMYAADLVLLIISLSFAYLIRHGKELKGRWRYKKGKRSSVHYSDD